MVSNFNLKLVLTLAMVGVAAVALVTGRMTLGLDLQGGTSLRYSVAKAFEEQRVKPEDQSGALRQTIEIIQERIDSLGLREPVLRPQGTDEFNVELPGISQAEADTTKAVIARQGNLEFRLQAFEGTPEERGLPRATLEEEQKELDAYFAARDPAEKLRRDIDLSELTKDLDGKVKGATFRWLPISERMERGDRGEEYDPEKHPVRWMLIKFDTQYVVRGTDLEAVRPSQDTNGHPAVAFDMRPGPSTTAMGKLTGENLKRALCIVLDGEIESWAVIQDRITDHGQISGGRFGFSQDALNNLIIVLKSGSLPVKPELLSQSVIGPTLGEASIVRGRMAAVLGLGLVCVFMMFYYLVAGVIATVTLLSNMLVLVGTLTLLQATLTLPGIAGIALTIGMAVDANILIYERIREESEKGKTLFQSAKTGFERAFVTIFDSNVTTLLTGVILYKVGAGPIRGFAVTLILGILSSMFSALVISKLIIAVLVEREKIKRFKMRRWVADSAFPFLRYTRAAVTGSVIVIAAGLYFFFSLGDEKYGLDFLGGYKATVQLSRPATQQEVLSRVQTTLPGAEVVSIRDQPEITHFQIKVKKVAESSPGEEAAALTQPDPASGASPQSAAGEGGTAVEMPAVASSDETGEALFLAEVRKALGDLLVAEPITGLTCKRDESAATTNVTCTLTFSEDILRSEIEAAFRRPMGDAALEGPETGRSFKLTGTFPAVLDEVTAAVRITQAIKDAGIKPEAFQSPILENTFIGARVGGELRDAAILAIILSLIVIVIYVRVRFKGYRYGIGAVVALAHDVLVSLGAVAFVRWLGFVEIEIDLALIAALLTIIGYSLNDTIVIFDRIRENLPRVEASLHDVVNSSVNQTLSRTFLTAGTTFITVLIIFILNFGQGNVLEGFSFTMMVGIVAGTYSTVFIASPVMIWIAERYGRKAQVRPRPAESRS
ncbi:MAG: protein translocase subunit SecD [Planctomycetota bacterium]